MNHRPSLHEVCQKLNVPLVANAVELLIDLLEGNLVLCIKHILVSLLAEVLLKNKIKIC